jgi:uncharacterized protein (TIGR02118 family)
MNGSLVCLYTPLDIPENERVNMWRTRLADVLTSRGDSGRSLLYEVVAPKRGDLRSPRSPDVLLELRGTHPNDFIGRVEQLDKAAGVPPGAIECYPIRSHEIIAPTTQMPDDFVMLYVMYRWHGKSPREFAEHYLQVHCVLGSKVPGLKWYDVNLTQHDDPNQIVHPPRPDAFAFCAYDDEATYDKAMLSPESEASVQDDTDFCGAYYASVVRRRDLVY